MAKHRSHGIEFKRQVAREFLAGETLHGLAKRHDLAQNLIRKYRARSAGDDHPIGSKANVDSGNQPFSVTMSKTAILESG